MKVLIGANPMGLEDVLSPTGQDHPDVEFVHEPDRDKLQEKDSTSQTFSARTWVSSSGMRFRCGSGR